jgi:Zn finger protein HypA/HybF involved in hydrogenase expression
MEDKNITFKLNGFTESQVAEISEAQYIQIEQSIFIRKEHAAKIMDDEMERRLKVADKPKQVHCPECNQPFVTYSEDCYYHCNSCNHQFILN